MEAQKKHRGHEPKKLSLRLFSKKAYISTGCIRLASFFSEIILGSLIGGLAGWAISWRLGAAYIALYKPTYLLSSQDITAWYYMPATFAGYGLWIGVAIGILAAHLYAHHLLKERIALLYEKGQTDQRQLAHILDQREQKIGTIIRQLIQKGRLPQTDAVSKPDIPENYCERDVKIKKTDVLCVALLSTFFLFGCLPSLHPLYTEDTLVFDEQLVGKWYGEGEIWSFVKAGEKKYGLSVLDDDDGKRAAFEVHLVQLGEHRFIDLYPGENMGLENTPEMYGCNMVPAHTFMKVELSDPNLKLQWVYLGELIEDDPNILNHEILDKEKQDGAGGSILITAKSEDIQRVLLQNLEKVLDEDAGSGQFRRCPSVFSEKDILFDPKLIGQWKSQKGQDIDILQGENLGYEVKIIDETNTGCEFTAVLFMLKNMRLLGLFYTAPSQADKDAGFHLIPDTFLLVGQMGPELILREIDWEAMTEFLHGEQELDSGELSDADFVLQKADGHYKTGDGYEEHSFNDLTDQYNGFHQWMRQGRQSGQHQDSKILPRDSHL